MEAITETVLAAHGADSSRGIYVSLFGVVFDVSSHPSGPGFYGPGAPYSCLAGKEATLSLAKMELSLAGDLVKLDQLTEEEKATATQWLVRFGSKYKVVGYYIPLRSEPVATDPSSGLLDIDHFSPS